MMKKTLITEISGFPEYSPAEQVIFDHIINIIKSEFEIFGFQHIETPAIERKDVLGAKGGNEKEIYAITRMSAGPDENAETDMGLHFDLTVPLARYVAMRQRELVFPFRRYQIQKVWRGERTQAGRGRYREFYQCDIDIVGRNKLGLLEDAEVAYVVSKIFSTLAVEFELGNYVIRINNRNLIQGYLESQGITDDLVSRVLEVLDGMEKISEGNINNSLQSLGVSVRQVENIMSFCRKRGPCISMLAEIAAISERHEAFTRGLNELIELVASLEQMKAPLRHFEIDLGIIRGLDYYTGTVYETQLVNFPKLGSVCSGGRYENLADHFGGVKLPGVGISIGATRLFAGLLEMGVFKFLNYSAGVLVTTMDSSLRADYFSIAEELRAARIRCEVFLADRKLKEQLEYGNKRGFTVCIVMGSVEAGAGVVQIKQMHSGMVINCARKDIVVTVMKIISGVGDEGSAV